MAEPYVAIHWNMYTRTWIVMQAPAASGPLRWEPLWDHEQHDVAAAYALKLRRAYRARVAPRGPAMIHCNWEGGDW